VSYKYI